MARHRKSSRGSITERSRKNRPPRYEIRITVGYTAEGKQIQTSKSFPTHKEAEKYKAEQLANLDKNIFRLPSKITVKEWFSRWLDECIRNTVKESTYSAYKGIIENHIKPNLGDIQLNKLNFDEIQRFYNGLVERKKPLSQKTINNINLVLHDGLKEAVAQHLLDFDPLAGRKRPKSMKVSKETAPLTVEQIGKLFKVTEGHPYQPLYILAIYTGMRVSELLGLQWSDVDFDSETITVRQQLQKLREEGRHELIPTKNGKVRRIPMYAEVVNTLRFQKRRQDEWRKNAGELWCESDFVFTKENGDHLTQPSVYHHVKKAMARIGRPDAYFHTLRSTFCTLSTHYTGNVEAASKIAGHHSSAFTEKHYVRTPDRYLRENEEEYGSRLSADISSALHKGTDMGFDISAKKEKALNPLGNKAFNKRNVAEVERFELSRSF